MPRPKLYNTPEECREAKRMHKCAYYAHNKSVISAKMKDKYRARVDRDNMNPHKTSFDIISFIAPKSRRNKLQGPLKKYLGGEPRGVINELLLDYLETGVSDQIHSAVGVVKDIFRELWDAEDDLSQQGKSGIGYTSACQATKDAKDVLLALEDVLSFILVDSIKLEELHSFNNNCTLIAHKASAYRHTKWSMRGIFISHYTCHTMAPPKWTSDEQEEWLKPYYEAYLVKQSEKCRNYRNFFMDLYENWFEAFPELRPTGVTALGPTMLEELNEMKSVEDARKVKLHNRFKNNFGAMKAGRKAKAHATNRAEIAKTTPGHAIGRSKKIGYINGVIHQWS
ncbi:hypothetical protein F4604DRAFT_1679493 [Suillus subluteus]|nr:hypothetical protein F4604DRAFT_1679493 [Suillus subluteus]